MKNLAGFQLAQDKEGRMVQLPVPFNCACGQRACYWNSGWWCTFCWQKKS